MDGTRLKPSDALTPNPGEFPGEPPFRESKWFVIVPLAGVLSLVGAISLYRPLDPGPFFVTDFPLCFVSLLLIAQIKKKKARGEDVSVFFPYTAWIAYSSLLVGAIVFANGALDRSPIDPHESTVMHKTVARGKGTTFSIEFASWRPDRSFEKMDVPEWQFDEFQINDPIIVDLRAGAFRIPWVAGIRQGHLTSKPD